MSKKTSIEIDFDAIAEWLDHGELKNLAESEGISFRQASNIIHGRSKNLKFLEKLISAAEKNMRLAERAKMLRENLKLIK